MENKKLFGKMCYIARQMRRENNAAFLDYGVTPIKLQVLVYIFKSGKSGQNVCQKDVERELNLRPSSVSTLLSNLERDGFITRSLSDGDARTKFASLTEKGKSLCIKNKLLMDECDAAIQLALSEEEQKNLDLLLTKVINGLSSQY